MSSNRPTETVAAARRLHWRVRWGRAARRTKDGRPACNQWGSWSVDKWLYADTPEHVTCKRCRKAIRV